MTFNLILPTKNNFQKQFIKENIAAVNIKISIKSSLVEIMISTLDSAIDVGPNVH